MSSALLRSRVTLILSVSALVGVAAASVGPVAAQPQETTAQVRSWVERYEDAWNTHKATAVGAFFSEDADMIIGNGPRIVGRESIQAWWARYFSNIDQGRRGTFDIDSIRVITPEVVLVNVDSTTAGRESNGQELPTRLARGTWVVSRHSSGWQITALRALPAAGDVRSGPGRDH